MTLLHGENALPRLVSIPGWFREACSPEMHDLQPGRPYRSHRIQHADLGVVCGQRCACSIRRRSVFISDGGWRPTTGMATSHRDALRGGFEL